MGKTALLSTGEPEKVINQCRRLVKLGWKLIASRETVEVLRKENVPIEDIKDFVGVGYEYGIPPTLHPKIEQALTQDCEQHIDLVYDIPYPITQGNDVGGRTLLALGAKGRRLVINNYNDLENIVRLLEQTNTLPDGVYDDLISKVNFEIAKHYLLLSKKHSKQYEGILGQYTIACREGENPYQTPCALFEIDTEDPIGISQFTQLSGEPMCFTNMADMDSILITIEKLQQAFMQYYEKLPFIAVAAKHGNPCGVGVDWLSKDSAINKALWGNPQAIWGGEFVSNFEIDNKLAKLLLKSKERKKLFGSLEWMLDVIVAPGFSTDAMSLLSTRKQSKLMSNSAINRTITSRDKWQYRFVRGGFLRQPQADYVVNLSNLDWIESLTIDTDSLLIAWATSYTSFQGGNEVSIARDSMLIGVGGGPSTVMAAQHAVDWAKSYGHETEGAMFCADAFFPHTDAPEILIGARCKGGIVPGGGRNHDVIYKLFKDHSVNVGFISDQYRGFCRH